MAVALAIQGAPVEDVLRLAYPSLLALHDPARGLPGAHPPDRPPTRPPAC